MSYIDDIENNINRMDEHIAHMEEAIKNDWTTVYGLAQNNLKSVLKSTKFCVACAKRKAEKLGIFGHEFKCGGGCIRGGQINRVKEINDTIYSTLGYKPEEVQDE